MSNALRRKCKRNPQNQGEGWYFTTGIDTVQKVADDFCMKPEVVRHWNNINPKDDLRPGVNIKVRCTERKRDCLKNPSGNGAYIVASGDEYKYIAPDFCTSVDKLKELNPKVPHPDTIQPGLLLWVPCPFNDVP